MSASTSSRSEGDRPVGAERSGRRPDADGSVSSTPAGRRASEVEPFVCGDLHGEVALAFRPSDLEGEVRRLIDPVAARRTLHWGRNYLYTADLGGPEDTVEVVVKQFRNDGLLGILRRRLRGSKAARSWRIARAMARAGLPTAEPVMLVESARLGGPSFYVCRYLEGVFEARYLFRAVAAGRQEKLFPEITLRSFAAALGGTVRRLHDAGIWHRDVSMGNLLLRPRPGAAPAVFLVDLNRARIRRRLTVSQRTRDLCRVPVLRREEREELLRAYWGEGTEGRLWQRLLLACYQRGFLWRQRLKGALRAPLRGLRGLLPRRPHAHIPAAPAGASRRDKVAWDRLSDQPHQHAGRLERLAVRLADAGAHLEASGAALGAAPRAWRRYRELRRELGPGPRPWGEAGIAVRPWPAAPEALLGALEDLGLKRVLLRLHPWQDDHREEESLAEELHRRGYDLTFALPQSRELVRDPGRWRSAIAELGERFRPFGRRFQVGQAINRSKWGAWTYPEYLRLAEIAAEILRSDPGVELLGPAVIDFEPHAAAAVLNLPAAVRFDIVSSLLYVDRRGAPENRQLGFDAETKAILLKAIAETSRNGSGRCWITEVNWPLREGPHSPAGRQVAVDEERQADYLVRYFLLTLGSGCMERVYWWQLVARGYGLMAPAEAGLLRARPSFRALAALGRLLGGATFLRPLPAPEPARLYLFRDRHGEEIAVGWSPAGRRLAALPRPTAAAAGRDGEPLRPPEALEAELRPSPRYFRLSPPAAGGRP